MRSELRYSLVIALILVIMTTIVSIASPIELLFSVEPRLIAPNGNLVYVVYDNDSIYWVNYTPLYIYAWRFSAVMFLLWIATVIIYVVKPLKTADALSMILAVVFAASEYIYLYSIGAKVTILPLTYILYTIGKPLLFIDVGQLALIYALWRAFKNSLISIRRGGK
ncbi:MAG: hypothetical protein ACP5L1_03455 [Caldivirga sp.]|jgi:hypothetical protein|uniref:hypothetical protein n=1 Tax=Caldivirga sp. TaxID=2080243 RepID=UPI003D0D1D14